MAQDVISNHTLLGWVGPYISGAGDRFIALYSDQNESGKLSLPVWKVYDVDPDWNLLPQEIRTAVDQVQVWQGGPPRYPDAVRNGWVTSCTPFTATLNTGNSKLADRTTLVSNAPRPQAPNGYPGPGAPGPGPQGGPAPMAPRATVPQAPPAPAPWVAMTEDDRELLKKITNDTAVRYKMAFSEAGLEWKDMTKGNQVDVGQKIAWDSYKEWLPHKGRTAVVQPGGAAIDRTTRYSTIINGQAENLVNDIANLHGLIVDGDHVRQMLTILEIEGTVPAEANDRLEVAQQVWLYTDLTLGLDVGEDLSRKTVMNVYAKIPF